MKLNKILAMILTVVTLMSLGTCVFASRSIRNSTSKVISEVEITITEPSEGVVQSAKATSTTDGVDSITMTWLDNTLKRFMTANETYISGHEYEARIYVSLKEGYSWAEGTDIKFIINGKDVKASSADERRYVITTYTAEKIIKIDKIQAQTITLTPKVGATATKKIVLKTEGLTLNSFYFPGERKSDGKRSVNVTGTEVYMDLKDGYELADNVTGTIDGHKVDVKRGGGSRVYMIYEEEKVIDTVVATVPEAVLGQLPSTDITSITKGIATIYVAWIKDGEKLTLMNATEKFDTDVKYILRVFVVPSEGYEWADKVTFKVNGTTMEAQKAIGGEKERQMLADFPISFASKEPTEKVIDKVEFLFDEPIAGKVWNDKITTKTEGVSEVTISWINQKHLFMSTNEEFEAGNQYEARITARCPDGYKFATDAITKANGEKVDASIANKQVYISLLYIAKPEEQKIDEQKMDYPWTKASDWAEEELIEANEKELIPSCLEDVDYTKNITRAEFAAAAVKLYEKLTGTKAVAIANNPFTDTKDVEVLKAFNIGITTGTSETTFEPNAEITREQMATMMTRALTKAGINTKKPTNAKLFADDSEISSWASDSVYYMSSKEIIKGIGVNTFSSKGTASREQALLVSIRSFKKLGK